MENSQELMRFIYGDEGFEDALSTRARPGTLARGSRNLIPDEPGTMRPFRGIDNIGIGARLMFLAGETWAGLADTEEQTAAGSLFSWIADMLIFAGYGQVIYDGEVIADVFASSLVQLLLRWQGSYESANSGPFVAGLPQPSAPTVGLIETSIGGTPQTNGTYSFKVSWIRTTTFGRSIASPTSVTVIAQGKGVYLVVGEAPEGATNLVVWVTKRNLGGLGLHYRLVRANPYTGLEYKASEIERQLTDVQVTNASPVVTSALGAFSAQDVGKRFEPESSGFSVPAGTTILSVNDTDEITLSNNVTVTSGSNPRTASIISYVAGFDRSVLLNWQESDLTDESAWIEDYPPAPASHVFPLEKVLGIISDADSFDLASGTNRGTTAAFSLKNLPESFNPLHKLYLPQKVVDVMHRGVDSYVFVASKGFIGAFQYLDIEGSAPATLTTILPTEGIVSRNNWCLHNYGLYLFTAKGVAKRVVENGAVDETFSIRVRRFMKTWTELEKVILGSYADGVSVVYLYKFIALLYNTQLDRWSAILYLNDFVSDVEIISALGVDGKLLLSGTAESISDEAILFEFDSGADSSLIAAISPYTETPAPDLTKILTKIAVAFNTDDNDLPVFVSVHINDEITHITDAQIDEGENTLSSASSNFNDSFLGKYVLINNAGNTQLRARIIEILSRTRLKIGTCERILADCVDLPALHSVNDAYCVIAHRIYEFSASKDGINRPMPKDVFLNGVKSYAIGIIMETEAAQAMPLYAAVSGTVNTETTWQTF